MEDKLCQHSIRNGDVCVKDKQPCIDCGSNSAAVAASSDSIRAKAPAAMSAAHSGTGSQPDATESAEPIQQSEAPATEGTEASVSSDKKSKNERKNNKVKFCTTNCEVSNTQNMTKCCMCSKWYHMKCLKLRENDIGGGWHCPECGRMPSEVKDMNSKIDSLTDLVRSLVENGNEDRQTNRENVCKLEEENAVLRHQNEALTRKVNEPKRRLNEQEQRKAEHDKSLLLGSSIVRNIDEKKLANTEIRCLRGAKVNDPKKELQEVNSAGKNAPKSSYWRGKWCSSKTRGHWSRVCTGML